MSFDDERHAGLPCTADLVRSPLPREAVMRHQAEGHILPEREYFLRMPGGSGSTDGRELTFRSIKT
jgi:hypothetical protein